MGWARAAAKPLNLMGGATVFVGMLRKAVAEGRRSLREQVPSLGIRGDAITFANCTMESEKFITVREQTGDQVRPAPGRCCPASEALVLTARACGTR
jgi:hypothetical protein